MCKNFRDKPLPTSHYDALGAHQTLINRAIGMHFLREGQFDVASTFLDEVSSNGKKGNAHQHPNNISAVVADDKILDPLRSEALKKDFANMYFILDEMKAKRNLLPASAWARDNSSMLEARGSNLEFELARLQFVWLFAQGTTAHVGSNLSERQQAAINYARREFGCFQGRYLHQIQQLVGAMAFCPNLEQSPYRQLFYNDRVWEDLAISFTREFCSLLKLSADSPLYIATTAGAIAIPTLQKLQVIMQTKRTEWTTQNELPVRQ